MDDSEVQVWRVALLSRGFEEEEARAISNREYLLWAEARRYLGVSDQIMSGLSLRGKLISLKDEVGRVYRPYRYDLKHIMALDTYRNSKHRGRQKPSTHKITSVPVTVNTSVNSAVEEEVITPGLLLD